MEWIRYPIPNKNDLVHRLSEAVVFSKFNMKSGFGQIQISENDRYKTAFTTHFGYYEWNVMPFGLKNAPSEFQNIMNDISIIQPLFILMMFLFTLALLMNTRNICIHFWILSKETVLLSLLRNSNCFKQKFVSLAMTSLKDRFVLLIEPFNLLISFLMLSLIKLRSKDFLGL